MAERVRIFEVGPRDGLQNEKQPVATEDKIRFVDLLSAAGLTHIEAASFVSPKWVPQLADGAGVLAGLHRHPGTRYAALVPNLLGINAAIAAQADEVAVFASASESFSLKNINCSVDESLARFQPVMMRAAEAGLPVRGYVSCVTDCPFEGRIAPQAVARVAEALASLGCYEISLGDTTGQGRADTVAQMLDAVLAVLPASHLAGHFHDTAGRALENIGVSLEAGLRVFDASTGGIGGCPYAPGATGNIATGAVVDFLEGNGFTSGVDRGRLDEAAYFITQTLRLPNPFSKPWCENKRGILEQD